MFETRRRLQNLYLAVLKENERLRRDKEVADRCVANYQETIEKLQKERDDLKKQLAEANKVVEGLTKKLAEASTKLRDQAAADVLLHALVGLKKVFSGAMQRQDQRDSWDKEYRDLQKRWDEAQAAFNRAAGGTPSSLHIPTRATDLSGIGNLFTDLFGKRQ